MGKQKNLIFKSEDDWWLNAVIYNFGDKWHVYSEGYKLAADKLVESLKENQSSLDFMIFPIVFLYRQGIELTLKKIIIDGHNLLANPEQFPKHHDIQVLWDVSRKILEQVFSSEPKNSLDTIEKIIKNFNKYDPTSESFRYPIDKKGKNTLNNLSHINIRNLKDIMDKIWPLLDGAIEGLSYYLDARNDMLSSL